MLGLGSATAVIFRLLKGKSNRRVHHNGGWRDGGSDRLRRDSGESRRLRGSTSEHDALHKAQLGNGGVAPRHRFDTRRRTEEGELRLGLWVIRQRKFIDTLSVERRKRLEDIGFVWDPLESSWEEAFAALSRFKSREGHCLVPTGHMEGELKVNLGTWVIRQRKFVDSLSVERKKRLDDIGFVWDPLESSWEEAFAALNRFKSREGHCRVPHAHREGELRLGMWVHNQRYATLSVERKKRLDDIGFVWRSSR
jgi:hypothetical protein